MRVFYLITELYEGGAENALFQIAKNMKKCGHEVTVACLYGGEGEVAKKLRKIDIEVYDCGIVNAFFLFRLISLRKKIRRLRPDVIHSWLFRANLATLCLPKLNTPICWGLRVLEPSRLQNFLYGFFKNHCQYLFCVSPEIKSAAEIKLSWPSDRLSYIGNGVDKNFYSKRKNTDSTRTSFKGLCVARKVPQKGLDIFLDALAKVDSVNWHWTFVGDAPNKSYEEELKEKISLYQLEDRIEWLPSLSREDLLAYWSEADLFALPSRWEGQANVVLEAMSAGVPVLASENSGYEDTAPMILVRPNSSDAWASNLSLVIEDRRLLIDLQEKANEWIKSRSWESVTDKYMSHYKALI